MQYSSGYEIRMALAPDAVADVYLARCGQPSSRARFREVVSFSIEVLQADSRQFGMPMTAPGPR